MAGQCVFSNSLDQIHIPWDPYRWKTVYLSCHFCMRSIRICSHHSGKGCKILWKESRYGVKEAPFWLMTAILRWAVKDNLNFSVSKRNCCCKCKWKYLWSKCNSYVCENVIKLRGKMWFLRQINLTLIGILLVHNLLLLLFTQLLFCQLSGEGQIYLPLHFCFFDEGNSFDDKTGMMLHILNSEGADRNWNVPPHGNFYKLQTHSSAF